MELVYLSLAVICLSIFLIFLRRVHLFLHYFQQEEYQNQRFFFWCFRNFYFDRKVTLVFGLLIIALYFIPLDYDFATVAYAVFIAIASIIAVVWVYTEANPRSSPLVKKKLVITKRVKRIRAVTFAVFILFSAIGFIAIGLMVEKNPRELLLVITLFSILIIQFTPFYIIAANFLLSFNERSVQKFYLNDAKRVIKNYAPLTIGITGSYGKTSTKMVLNELLTQTTGPTFTPTGSINTLMGVTSYIRNNLKAFHKYAIIEMGAYGVGSIKKLCALTPPDAGIVTRVGIMHLERYGTQENIYKAKSELPQEIPDDGILVCNGDDLYCRKMAEKYKKSSTLLYGYDNSNEDLDAWISDLHYDKNGSHFTIHFKGASYKTSCGILGKPLLSNVLASFTMVCALGASPDHVATVIKTLKSYNNRLQLVNNGNTIELRDAYNSNPDGFEAALSVLGGLKGNNKILITPGMVELGDREYEENKKIAAMAADICDYVIVVGDTNKKAFFDGLASKGFEQDKIIFEQEMKFALAKLKELKEDGDVILIENDLPDIYEKLIKI